MDNLQISYDIPKEYLEISDSLMSGYTPIFTTKEFLVAERYTGKKYLYKSVKVSTKELNVLECCYSRISKSRHNELLGYIFDLYHNPERPAVLRRKKRIESEAREVLTKRQSRKERKRAEIRKNAFYSTNGPFSKINQQSMDNSDDDCGTHTVKYIFEQVLTKHGYRVRTDQIELAGEILKSMRNRNILLSEAGVGIGKTYAYLIAAILYRKDNWENRWIWEKGKSNNKSNSATQMPIVISTSSIALQRAILKEYIPDISEILLEHGIICKPLTAVLRKGKEHYICDDRLKKHAGTVLDKSKAAFLKSLQKENIFSLDLDEKNNIDAYVKDKIKIKNCAGTKCKINKDCRYLRFIDYCQSNAHDFQICNHNYFLADISRRNNKKAPLIPNYQAAIIDEAHKLFQAAQQTYGSSISDKAIPKMTKLLCEINFKQSDLIKRIRRICGDLTANNTDLFYQIRKNVKAIDEYDDDTEKFTTDIDSYAKIKLKKMVEKLEEIQIILNENPSISFNHKWILTSTVHMINSLIENLKIFRKTDEIIYWYENPIVTRKNTNEGILCAIPKNISEILIEQLWSKGFASVLTSGTLSVGGSFEYIKKQLGLNKYTGKLLSETSMPSPFDYKKNCLLYISEKVPFPDNKSYEYINAVAEEIYWLIKATHGHTGVLFTSYKVMELVYKQILECNFRFPIIKMGKNGLISIDAFKKSKNGVIFSAGALWEGVDFPGDILSSLIIVKLPFRVPDPISEYEKSQYVNMQEYKDIAIFSEMGIKLKQGFGRLIRKEEDTGVISVLDSRVGKMGAYRKRVLNTLPECDVTDKIMDVETFIEERKNKEYFK